MREIKFRAWGKENNIMLYNIQNFCLYAPVEYEDMCLADFLADKNYKVMQYTGLKDKNGKEIYEGDIISYKALKEKRKDKIFRNVIEWANYSGTLGWIIRGNDKRVYIPLNSNQVFNHNIEIIGNIYENPELLKGKT